MLPTKPLCAAVSALLLLVTNSIAASPTQQKRWPTSSHYVELSKIGHPEHQARSFSTAIRPALNHLKYAVEVKFNGIPRYLVVDTGSSDTWMVKDDFQCLNAKGKQIPQNQCLFGETYTRHVDPIKDEIFYIAYGSGEFNSGPFGFANVTVGGITVDKQKVSLVDRAYHVGDGLTSGLVGLGPRSLTSAYPGNNPNKHPLNKIMTYPPLFESMYNRRKQINPVFSLALQRGKSAGYLAFGGLPPIDFAHDFATTPFVGMKYAGRRRPDRYYPIQPQSYELDGHVYKTTYTAIVDSGTFANRLPKEIADKINAAFDPPAKYIPSLDLYATSCNATVPKLSFGIGGKMFKINPEDMFFARLGNKCATSITKGFSGVRPAYPEGFFILGDAFLHNVVAVFDVGNKQMHFAPHSY